MKTNTFILILSIYGFLLGFIMLVFPAFAVSNYAGDPTNVHETSTMRFFGALQLSYVFVALAIRNSTDTKVVRAYLLASAFVLFGSLAIGLYYVFTNQVPFYPSNWLDITIWTIFGIGALYFWNKEK